MLKYILYLSSVIIMSHGILPRIPPWLELLNKLRGEVQQDICLSPEKDLEVDDIDPHEVRRSIFDSIHRQSSETKYAFERFTVIRDFSHQLCDLEAISKSGPVDLPYQYHLNQQICDRTAGPNCYWAEGLKYRTIDGLCNNLINGRWGAANTRQSRLLPPQYDDGKGLPRGFQRSLPSPRTISEQIFNHGENPTSDDEHNSLILWAWGQFLDHDITFTPTQDEHPLHCCGQNIHDINAGCFPILKPDNNLFCIPFTRSAAAPEQRRPNACQGRDYREQINEITAFIDAGNVYGNTYAVSQAIAADYNGKLKSTANGRRLPRGSPKTCKERSSTEQFCQLAGDRRVNEVPSLGLMHTIFVRYHNIIAHKLHMINPHWSSATLYMETRRIIGAILQHVTYNHYLPRVLGHRYMTDLYSQAQGEEWKHTYLQYMDPSISNAFAAASFRFGHTQIPPHFSIAQAQFPIDDILMDPHLVVSNEGIGMKKLLDFLLENPAKKVDSQFEEAILNRLFKDENGGNGLDLGALNIQRGRDHGLPPYYKYKQLCNQHYKGLPHHDYQTRKQLLRVYKSEEEIDLFVGGVTELAVEGGVVGPVFACIIRNQFFRLKYADRYWYERGPGVDSPGAFTLEQLKIIKSVTLGRIFCEVFTENPEALQSVSYDVFDFGPGAKIDCTVLKTEWLAWKDHNQ